MTIAEKTAYLKGLTEGLCLDPGSKDAKLWGALNDLLSDIAHKLEEFEDGLDAHEASLDDVYEQLISLQEIAEPAEPFSADAEDYEEDEDDDGMYASSLSLYDDGEAEAEEPLADAEEDADDAEFDAVLYDVTCPGCGETLTFDESTLEQGGICCPYCGEMLEFDLGEDDEEDGDADGSDGDGGDDDT